MNTPKRILLLAVAVLISLGTPVLARDHHDHWRHGWRGDHFRHNRVIIVNPAPVYQYSPYRHYPYYNYSYPYYGRNVIVVPRHHRHHHR